MFTLAFICFILYYYVVCVKIVVEFVFRELGHAFAVFFRWLSRL